MYRVGVWKEYGVVLNSSIALDLLLSNFKSKNTDILNIHNIPKKVEAHLFCLLQRHKVTYRLLVYSSLKLSLILPKNNVGLTF